MGREKMGVLTRVLEGKNEADAAAAAAAGAGGSGGEGVLGPRYEVVVYPGAKHGFAVRGDRADPMQREKGEQSEDQAVKWFRRWFA
jgi:dienelactone hydrolase